MEALARLPRLEEPKALGTPRGLRRRGSSSIRADASACLSEFRGFRVNHNLSLLNRQDYTQVTSPSLATQMKRPSQFGCEENNQNRNQSQHDCHNNKPDLFLCRPLSVFSQRD